MSEVKSIFIMNSDSLSGAYTTYNEQVIKLNVGKHLQAVEHDDNYLRFVQHPELLIHKKDCRVVQFI